jgi:hypothetical protein
MQDRSNMVILHWIGNSSISSLNISFVFSGHLYLAAQSKQKRGSRWLPLSFLGQASQQIAELFWQLVAFTGYQAAEQPVHFGQLVPICS